MKAVSVRLITRPFSQEEWNGIVSDFSGLSLMQTWEYAEAKRRTGSWETWRAIFETESGVAGAVQALVRPVPIIGGGFVWINRGPLWRRPENEGSGLLWPMLSHLRQYWAVERRMYVRLAPTIHEGEAGPESPCGDRYRVAETSVGWASARLDLSNSLGFLRSQMQQKWRNGLNKAERMGIAVDSDSATEFHEVLAQYDRMLRERQYPTSITVPMLVWLRRLLPQERQIWTLVGRQGPHWLGGILLARYGDTCEYLVSAITNAGKAANLGNLLLWQAVCQAKAYGYRWFDLGGLDPQWTPPGILHFKTGVNGECYRLIKELETDDGGWRARIVSSRVRKAHD